MSHSIVPVPLVERSGVHSMHSSMLELKDVPRPQSTWIDNVCMCVGGREGGNTL